MKFYPDLHTHSTSSDGTDAPEQLVAKAAGMGITLLSVTDHDTYEGSRKALALAEHFPGLAILCGIEFSCRDTLGSYHILGYCFDPENPAMCALVQKSHDNRMRKVMGRLEYLEQEFGFSFAEEEIRELMRHPNPGKPHIGNLMVKKGYAADRNEAISRYVDGFHEDHLYIRPEEAIQAIREAEGISVLAHPIFGDGRQNLTAERLEERVNRLMSMGLMGLECFYSRHTVRQREQLLEMAEQRNLLATAGSDYHGSNKKVALGETGFSADEIPRSLRRFLERINRRL